MIDINCDEFISKIGSTVSDSDLSYLLERNGYYFRRIGQNSGLFYHNKNGLGGCVEPSDDDRKLITVFSPVTRTKEQEEAINELLLRLPMFERHDSYRSPIDDVT